MSYRKMYTPRSNLCWLVFCAAAIASGCKPATKSAAKPTAPAKVELLPHESELASITLTEDADKRLGVEVVKPVIEPRQRRRTFGGEVAVPPGKIIQVTAQVGGRLVDATTPTFLHSGMKVRAGQSLLTLAPLLSPERDVPTPNEQVQMAGAKANLVAAQVTAQGDIERSAADLAAAKINVDRAQRLLADRAGSQRALDDAMAVYKVSEVTMKAARQRYDELSTLLKSLDLPTGGAPQATSIDIKSPLDGLIRGVSVSPGQPVVAGAPLFEVIDASSVWIRVPIFVDLVNSLNIDSEAMIVKLDGGAITRGPNQEVVQIVARPIAAPPSADASSASLDIYYEVINAPIDLRPGQRVGVSIPAGPAAAVGVLPAQSILYDYHGGTWIYLKVAVHKYQRTKVNVLWFDKDSAIVENRLPADVEVVTSGAAELFGTEFGPGK